MSDLPLTRGLTATLRSRYMPPTTGLVNGGLVVVEGSTTFTVQAGAGYVLDPGDLSKGNYIQWTETTGNVLAPQLPWENVSVFVDAAGTVVQMSKQTVTPADLRTKILLAVLKVDGAATIWQADPAPHTPANGAVNLFDYLYAINRIEFIASGVILQANGATLQLTHTDGVAFRYGERFQADPNNPNFVPVAGATAFSMTPILSDNTVFGASTDVSVGFYESAPGVRTSLGNNRWAIHLIIYRNGTYFQQYGQVQYNQFDQATSALNTYLGQVSIAPILATGQDFIGGVIAKGNATNLSASDALVFDRNIVASGVSGGATGTVTSVAAIPPRPTGNVQLNQFQDPTDATKFAVHDLSAISTATTRTFGWPNVDGTVVLEANTATLTNKSFDAAVGINTLTNVGPHTLAAGYALWEAAGAHVYRPSGDVGIGVPTSASNIAKLHVMNTGTVIAPSGSTIFVVQNTGAAASQCIASFFGGVNGFSILTFSRSGNTNAGRLVYGHTDDNLGIYVNGSRTVLMNRDNRFGVGFATGSTVAAKFHVRGETDELQFLVDGAPGQSTDLFRIRNSSLQVKLSLTDAGQMGLGKSSPQEQLDVVGNIAVRQNDRIFLEGPGSDTYITFNGTHIQFYVNGTLAGQFPP